MILSLKSVAAPFGGFTGDVVRIIAEDVMSLVRCV